MNTTKTTAKKRVLALALALILLLLALTRVTLSYFTDTKKATNTFTYGNVSVSLWERQDNSDFTNVSGGGLNYGIDNDLRLYPITNTTNPQADDNYRIKELKVVNDGDTSAYIRVFIRVPASLVKDYTTILHLDFPAGQTWNKYNTSDGQYAIYELICPNAMSANSTSELLLNGVFLDANADIRELGNSTEEAEYLVYMQNGAVVHNSGICVSTDRTNPNATLKIDVATQAVQADGFNNAQAAFAATFGNNDPWGGTF